MSSLATSTLEASNKLYDHTPLNLARLLPRHAEIILGILEINHELGARPLITSSSRKWGSILSCLDPHFHENDKVASGYLAISLETGYNVQGNDFGALWRGGTSRPIHAAYVLIHHHAA